MPSVEQVTPVGRELPITGGVQAEAGGSIGKETVEEILSREGG